MDEVIKQKEVMLQKVNTLHEVNPMLGHRGVRLGITFPEIYSMQIRAILEATAICIQDGVQIKPEIMVPQVSTVEELNRIRSYVDQIQQEVEAEYQVPLHFKFGSMIEVVRACMRAHSLADSAEFFSFGTNDLTQTALGISRDDSGNFLEDYRTNGIFEVDPFVSIDQEGVGELVRIACERGREKRPNLKLGICGEHGGDPASVDFFHRVGLDYVSASPYRVPIARLAAAQAALAD